LLQYLLLDIYHLCLLRLRHLARTTCISLGPATVCHFFIYLHLPSVSGQPFKETGPASLGHSSSLSAIPSPSVSGHPFNAAPATSGQESALSCIPSPVSGHPLNSFKPATSGQASSLSNIPSPSVSLPPNLKIRPVENVGASEFFVISPKDFFISSQL
jgi:hypothetical protein